MKRILVVTVAMFLMSCAYNRRTSVVEHTGFTGITSSAVGAGAGAVVGNQLGLAGEGAAVGAAAGLLSGVMLGAQLDSFAHRIERAQETLDGLQRELNIIRASLKEELQKGDYEILEDHFRDLKFMVEDDLKLKEEHKSLLSTFASLVKSLRFPFEIQVKINSKKQKLIGDTIRKPEDLVNDIISFFETEGLRGSNIRSFVDVQSDSQTTTVIISLLKQFPLRN